MIKQLVYFSAFLMLFPLLSNKCSKEDISGQKYELTKVTYASNNDKKAAGGKKITLEFNEAKEYNLQLSLNSCSGSYEVDGKKISIGDAACTKMCCDSKQSDIVSNALPKVTAYSYDGDILILKSDQGELHWKKLD